MDRSRYRQAISPTGCAPFRVDPAILSVPHALETIDHLQFEMHLRGLRLDVEGAIRSILRSRR